MIHRRRPAQCHLTEEVQVELEVKRSRFITHVARVDDQESARAMIARVKSQWPDARHHCSAFIVAVDGQHDVEHSSDDGEPSGTAGRPMLDVLRGADLGQVCAVVVRYFGGVLLGTGGLVRAYADSVQAAVAQLQTVTVEKRPLISVEVGHAEVGAVENALQSWGDSPIRREFGSTRAQLWVAPADPNQLRDRLAALSQGRAVVREEGTIDWEAPEETLSGDLPAR